MNKFLDSMLRFLPLPVLLLFLNCVFINGCSQISPDLNSEELISHSKKQAFLPSARYYYLISQMHCVKQEYNLAEDALKKAIEQDSDSSFLKRTEIEIVLAQNREEFARQLTQALVEEHPDDPENLLLSLKLNKKQNPAELSLLLNKILALDPNNKEAYLRLGKIYMEMPDYPMAEKLFSKMAEKFPQNYAAWFYLGESCLRSEKISKAIESFMKSIKLEPKLMEARFRLAEAIKKQQGNTDVKQLKDIYSQILEIDPKNHQAQMGIGLLYFQQGNLDKANELFDQLTKAISGDPHLLMLTADHFISTNQPQDGVIIFSRLLDANPDDDFVNFFAGMIYEANKDILAAIKCYKKITPGMPQYKKVILNIAILYRNLNQPENAIHFLEDRHKKHPEDSDITLYLLSFYDAQGLIEQATNLAKSSVKKQPDDTKLLFKLGELYDKTDNKQECIKIMKKIITMEPENANALNYLGYTYAEMGKNLDHALSLIQRALSIKPEDPYITDSLGWVYFQQKEYNKALLHLKESAKSTDYEATIADHLAQTYIKTHQPDMAIKVYKEAMNSKKNTKEINSLRKKIQAIELMIKNTGQTKK